MEYIIHSWYRVRYVLQTYNWIEYVLKVFRINTQTLKKNWYSDNEYNENIDKSVKKYSKIEHLLQIQINCFKVYLDIDTLFLKEDILRRSQRVFSPMSGELFLKLI